MDHSRQAKLWNDAPADEGIGGGLYEGYALSLKQPWAALLAHGHKTIEIRRWPTARRGRVLIHAARVSDERAEAWALGPRELEQSARRVGGIIGAAELTGCHAYRTFVTFAADRARHLNQPEWFQGPVLYGFTFVNAVALPFHPCAGWMRFFAVSEAAPRKR